MAWATDVFLDRDDVREALRTRDFGALFRLMNRIEGVSQTQIAATTGLTQGRVSRVMSGSKDRIVHIDVIERIADGLRIPGHLLGLAARPWEEDDEDDGSDTVQRRGLLQIGGALALGNLMSALSNEPEALNSTLDAGSITEPRLAELERTTAALGVDVVRLPPTRLLPQAVSQFRGVRRLVRQPQRTGHRVRLIRVGARLATVVGEVLFNEGSFDLAQQWYTTAHRAAVDVGDRSTADTALAGLCYLAIYGSDPREVLRLLDPRLGTGTRQATPPLAWLWAFQARAHAALGHPADTDRAFAHACEVLDRSASTQVTAGIFSFLPEKLAFYQANAYVALAAADQARIAADEALRLYDLSETTEPALVRFERASALAQAGELDEASRYAVATVLDPRTYPSITVRTRANAFGNLLDQIAGPANPVVREWHEVTANVYQPLPPLRGATPRKELSWATPNETI
jgi:transcriptional regulator with XRE-family HTH domain